MPYDELLCKIANIVVHPATQAGVIPFRVVEESKTEEDAGDSEDILSLGNFGIGGSLPIVRNQIHTSNLVELDEYGYLGPGQLHTKLGLAATVPISSMMALRDGSQSTGALNPTVASNDSAIGTVAWAGTGNVFASDDSRATVTLPAGATSNYIYVRGLPITSAVIPSHAVISGITVEVEESTTGGVALHSVNARLVKNGVIQTGLTRTVSGLSSSVDTYRTLGSSTDLWANTWTPADLQDADWGVAVYITNASGVSGEFRIDHIRITIEFVAAHVYLYVAGGVESRKIRLTSIGVGAAFGVVETKTFSAPVTDCIALKDTGGPQDTGGYVPRTGQPGNVHALFGFGKNAGLEQIDAVGYNTTDTYRSGGSAAKDAYGEVFGLSQGTTGTSSVVWKSTGALNQNSGPFSRIQSVEVPTADTDLTNDGAWGTIYKVGQIGSSVSSIVEFENGIKVGKPEGIYHFNTKYAAQVLFGMSQYKDGINGRGMTAWGDTLMIPTIRDLMAYPPMAQDAIAGLRSLVANQSDITGYPTWSVSFGEDLYVSFYNGTDSYICKLRRRRSYESVPHPLVIFPVVKVANYMVRRLFITDDGLGEYLLFYDCPSDTPGAYDVARMTLHPRSAMEYASGGTWESTLIGSPRHEFVSDDFIFDAEDCSASNYITVQMAWDKGDGQGEGSYQTVGTITAPGRNVIVLQPLAGTATGYTGRMKLVWTLASSSARPRIRGASLRAGQEVGIIMRGQRQQEENEEFDLTIMAGKGMITGQGGRDLSHPNQLFTALRVLRKGVHEFVYEHWFETQEPRFIFVKQVGFSFGPQDGPAPPQRYITIRGRLTTGQEVEDGDD